MSPYKIIVPKNQTVSQSLSIIVDGKADGIVVFDGGRVEDADYLCETIKKNGGFVKYWFVTHIHDDHIGALIKILSDKRVDIKIENIVYDFASFEWYYDMMGNDAGIYYLFVDALNEYKMHLENNGMSMNVFNEHYFSNYENDGLPNFVLNNQINVEMLNRHYELNLDPINNTSIVYKVNINDISMIIFGDLGYEGGEKLFEEISDELDVDILVLSHHGQNGIAPIHYKKFSPIIVIWPTSADIFNNTHGRYYTEDTKQVLNEIKSIKYQIKSYEKTAYIQ